VGLDLVDLRDREDREDARDWMAENKSSILDSIRSTLDSTRAAASLSARAQLEGSDVRVCDWICDNGNDCGEDESSDAAFCNADRITADLWVLR